MFAVKDIQFIPKEEKNNLKFLAILLNYYNLEVVMKFTDIDQLKALRYLNNLDVVERSLYKECELGRIDEIKLTSMLRDIADQRRNLYKAIEAISSSMLHSKYKSNIPPPMSEN